MQRLALLFALAWLAAASVAQAADTTTTSDPSTDKKDDELTAADVSLSFLTTEETPERALTDAELAATFNRKRCACAVPVRARVELTTEGAAKLADDELSVELRIGEDCDSADRADKCPVIGEGGTVSATDRTYLTTIGVDALFRRVTTEAAPCETNGTKSVTLWVWLHRDGPKLKLTPSRTLKLQGTRPPAPTIAEVVPGEGALGVTWKPPTNAKQVVAYQLVCDPGPRPPSDPAFEVCASEADARLDDAHVCSPKLGADERTTRITGLEDGISHAVAVVAVDAFGNPSAPSAAVAGTPGPSRDFYELYEEAGGSAHPGCTMMGAPAASRGCVGPVLLGLALLARRARRTRS